LRNLLSFPSLLLPVLLTPSTSISDPLIDPHYIDQSNRNLRSTFPELYLSLFFSFSISRLSLATPYHTTLYPFFLFITVSTRSLPFPRMPIPLPPNFFLTTFFLRFFPSSFFTSQRHLDRVSFVILSKCLQQQITSSSPVIANSSSSLLATKNALESKFRCSRSPHSSHLRTTSREKVRVYVTCKREDK